MAQRQIKMPVRDKGVPRRELSEEAPSQRKQTEAGRYLLQVDRQTKSSFNTFEAAQSAAMQIKNRVSNASGIDLRQRQYILHLSRLTGTVVIAAVRHRCRIELQTSTSIWLAEPDIDRRRLLAARFDVAEDARQWRGRCRAAAFPMRSKSDTGRFFLLHFISFAGEPIHAAASRQAKRMCNDRRELRDRSVPRR